MDFWSSLVGGAGGFLSSIVNALTGKKQNKRQNEENWRVLQEQERYATQERLATQEYNTSERLAAQEYNTSEREAQNDWNYNMWLEQIEYDSPAAQRQRMVDAGYNPLMLGDGAFGQSAPIQGASAATSDPAQSSPGDVSALPMRGDAFQLDMTSAFEIAQMWANTQKIEADTEGQKIVNFNLPDTIWNDNELKKAQTEYSNVLNRTLLARLPFARKRERAEILKLISERKTNDALTELYKQNKEHVKLICSKYCELKDAELKNTAAITSYYNALVEQKIPEEIKLLRSQVASNFASAAESRSVVSLNKVREEQVRSQTKWQDLTNNILEQYGSEQARTIIDNYKTSMKSVRLDMLIKTCGFKPESREALSRAMDEYQKYVEEHPDMNFDEDFQGFLQFIKDVPENGVVRADFPQHWYNIMNTCFQGLNYATSSFENTTSGVENIVDIMKKM